MCIKILIVEDEKAIADLLEERLINKGYQVRVAYTGSEAFSKLKEKSPDMITLDIYLPDENGLNILKTLKADPKTNDIPVIIISSSEEKECARVLGAEEFIAKPIDFPKLYKVLETAQERKAVV